MSSAEISESNQPRTVWGKIRRLGAELIGRELANRLTAPFYDWQARRNTRRFLAALPSRDLCVNLGCGYQPLKGWVNVDIARGYADVVWDLRRRLPFKDESCAAVFSEHVIEHLTREDGEHLLRECYRILQPGGVLRISTPDAGRYLRSYAGDQEFLYHPAFQFPIDTPLDRINQMMREGGQHFWVYDFQSLRFVVERIGFALVEEMSFDRTNCQEFNGADSPDREFESLYVEATR